MYFFILSCFVFEVKVPERTQQEKKAEGKKIPDKK